MGVNICVENETCEFRHRLLQKLSVLRYLGCRLANHQMSRNNAPTRPGRGWLAHHAEGDFAHLVQRYCHCGQGRCELLGHCDVVDAHHRDVVRDAQSLASQFLEYADCHQIAQRKNCAGTYVQLTDPARDSRTTTEAEFFL